MMNSLYTESFTLNEKKEILHFFEEYGYVVIDNILTKEECENTLDNMNIFLNKKLKVKNPDATEINIRDSSTYDRLPISPNFGAIDSPPIFTEQVIKNRQNAKLYEALCLIYNDKDIIISHDRLCFFRPTKINKKWATLSNYPGVHIDFGPYKYLRPEIIKEQLEHHGYKNNSIQFIKENNLISYDFGLQIQGQINLLDNLEEDGGFQCVPKFHKKIQEWLNKKEFPFSKANSYSFKDNCIDMQYVDKPIRICMKQGSICIWNQLLAHGSVVNNSMRPRSAQFFRAFPKKLMSDSRKKKRKEALSQIFKDNNLTHIIDDIGHVVFDL